MSLNWNTTDCVTPTPVDDLEAGQRECLIWGSIGIDLGEITQSNIQEWLFRFKFLETINRSLTTRPMTLEVIQRWIGLRTNVISLTRKKWMKRVMEQVEREVKNNCTL